MTHTRSSRKALQFHHQFSPLVWLLLAFAPLANAQQNAIHAPNAIAGVYVVHQTGRPLADLLLQLQQAFLSPIDYEEVAYESPTELNSKKIVTTFGPKTLFFTPITDLSVTLTSEDLTPYLAVHTGFSQYKNAGLYGASSYQVIQQSSRLDIMPYQVFGANGSWDQTIPVMAHAVSFPQIERSIEDTLNVIAAKLSTASGKKVVLMSQPFRFGEKVALGASGEMPGDLIARLGENLGTTLSYQCLYDASDAAYYLNIYPLVASVTGSLLNSKAPGVMQPIKPKNIFFTKDLTN